MIERMQVSIGLILVSILLTGAVGCAPQSRQPTAAPTSPPIATSTAAIPTVAVNVPDGWETFTNEGQCGYTISYPAEMEGVSQALNSWILSFSTSEPSGPVPNFVYVSVIPDDFQGGAGEIYNYDPAEAQTLLNMQIGESKSLRDDPDIAPAFTYTRLPDTTLRSQAAQTYENTQPWEFPLGTKEIRYYLRANGCTYLIGGYMATAGSGQPGGMDEELFDQIITQFQLNP